MSKIFCLIGFVLVVAGCAAPLPQTPPAGAPATVTAPEVRAGDTWSYRVHDVYTGLERGNQVHRVTDAGPDRISVFVSGGGYYREETYLYNREWNWLRHPATNLQTFDYSPAYAAFAFPLAPGKRWHARGVATDPAQADGRRFPVWIDGIVLGWERVKVPAGEFDTLKVERSVWFDYWEHNVRARSRIHEVEWYAPAVKQAIRRETRSEYLSFLAGGGHRGFLRVGRDNGGPHIVQDDWLMYELESYSVR